MLGSLGLWSSSKGMVLVPNLSGLTNTQAEAAIISAGLTYSGSSSTTTSNISLSNQVVSQLPNANELVPYGSDVSFIYYNYVATTTTTTTSGGGGGTPPPPVTTSAPVATISNLTYTKTGTTTGTLSWSGSNINNYLFTGNSSLYPSPYNYGAYTATWPGNLVNLTEGQSYTVTITVINSAGAGNSQTITFAHPVVTTTTTTSTTTTTTVSPTLPTPIIETFTGWQVYPGSVFATFDVMNFDSAATYTSSLGVRNPEAPEQWIVENLTPNQSYTVNITVSKPGYISATGSATFTSNPANNPTTTTTTTTTTTPAPTEGIVYLSYCFNGNPVQESFFVDSDNTVAQTLSQACAAYTLVIEGLNPPGTNISCSIVSQPAAPTGCPQPTTTTTTTTTTTAGTPPPTTTTTTTTTAAPGAFTISSISSTTNSITYSWSNPPAGTAFYTVQYSDNDSIYTPETTSSTSKTFTGLTPNTLHTVFVTAKSSSNGYLADASASISTSGAETTTTTTVAPTTTTTTAAPTTTTTTTVPSGSAYWYTGCCSASGTQVTGTSNSSFGTASDNMNAACSGTVTNVQSGNYGTIPTISCTATTTTTTAAAPATTTTTTAAAPATTTTTGLDCSGNTCDPARSYTGTRSVSTSVCASGTMNTYTCWTPGTCDNVTTDTGCAATAATTTTTTTAEAETYRLCTSFNVANQDCVSQGCSSGGCGSGSICTSGVQYRCAYV